MKIFILLLLLLIGCSSYGENSQDNLLILQSVWNSKDIGGALEKIKGLHKIEEDADYEVYGLGDRIKIFSLSISVLKKNKKIVSIVAPINKGEEVPSRLIKEKLKADDWKTYEHPVKGVDYLKSDITEYSEKLGIGFAYDKLDREKKTRMIYWGVEPKKIQTIL
jgi:hypothetical protein